MKIDYASVRHAFPSKAWAYAESYDAVKIGKWNGTEFMFYDDINEDFLLTLRVFDNKRELKFSGDKCRDTNDISKQNVFIPELAHAQYYMYGEKQFKPVVKNGQGYTEFLEARGGSMFFPGSLDFSTSEFKLKLGIRNFVRYNPVPVCPKDENYAYGLNKSGTGALEVVDYAYTGFYYEDGKAVLL